MPALPSNLRRQAPRTDCQANAAQSQGYRGVDTSLNPDQYKRESDSIEALKILGLLALCAVVVAVGKELGQWLFG